MFYQRAFAKFLNKCNLRLRKNVIFHEAIGQKTVADAGQSVSDANTFLFLLALIFRCRVRNLSSALIATKQKHLCCERVLLCPLTNYTYLQYSTIAPRFQCIVLLQTTIFSPQATIRERIPFRRWRTKT